MLFVRERGVIWHVDTPYKATYVITDAGMREIGANGQPGASHGGNDTRGAAQVSRMMRAMLGGDLSALYSQFDVQADGTPSQLAHAAHAEPAANRPVGQGAST